MVGHTVCAGPVALQAAVRLACLVAVGTLARVRAVRRLVVPPVFVCAVLIATAGHLRMGHAQVPEGVDMALHIQPVVVARAAVARLVRRFIFRRVRVREVPLVSLKIYAY